MKSVSQCIIEWLETYGSISIEDMIETEILPDELKTYALSKVPTNIYIEYVDGSRQNTEYYTFLTRQSTQYNTNRIKNDVWLNNLEKWIIKQDLENNLPNLDGNRQCDAINISSTFYLFETKERDSVYQLTLSITFREEY